MFHSLRHFMCVADADLSSCLAIPILRDSANIHGQPTCLHSCNPDAVLVLASEVLTCTACCAPSLPLDDALAVGVWSTHRSLSPTMCRSTLLETLTWRSVSPERLPWMTRLHWAAWLSLTRTWCCRLLMLRRTAPRCTNLACSEARALLLFALQMLT